MKIEAIDFFYLAMPEIRDVGDGSQDALLVRARAGEYTGWGECEASPLASIAAWIAPMSHSGCKPVAHSVLNQPLEGVDDIRHINAAVRNGSFDLLQADHTLSGVDIALWDLLGKKLEQPVYRLLGYPHAHPKVAYASALFGDDAQSTFRKAQKLRASGYRAAKFGWGPYGRGRVEQDADQVSAAREGLGDDVTLLVDAGTVFGADVEAARRRLAALESARATWFEEPFASSALEAYRALAGHCSRLRLAGGEGCHNFAQAKHMIDQAGIGYLQIDAGRIGGITTAKQVADYAAAKGVQFVNHTFTTHLALSASLHPYAGLADHRLCEFPIEPSPLARDLTKSKLEPDGEGLIHLPDGAGLGVEPDVDVIRKYLIDVEIRVGGRLLYRSSQP